LEEPSGTTVRFFPFVIPDSVMPPIPNHALLNAVMDSLIVWKRLLGSLSGGFDTSSPTADV
jgi:hypothetical protein